MPTLQFEDLQIPAHALKLLIADNEMRSANLAHGGDAAAGIYAAAPRTDELNKPYILEGKTCSHNAASMQS